MMQQDSEYLCLGSTGGGGGAHPNPIIGGLHTDGQSAFVDGRGNNVCPVSLHVGDLFWQWIVNPGAVEAFLDKCAAAGFHILRWWLLLNSRRDAKEFWTYLALGPKVVPNFYAHAVGLGNAIAARGMLSHISLGEYAGMSMEELANFYHHIRDEVVAGIGPDGCTLAGEVNEAHFDADGRSAAQVESLVNIIRARYPQNLYCLSHVMGTEDAGIIREWTPSWMNFFAIGGERGPDAWYDIANRHFEYGYGHGVRRLWIELEGENRRFSASQLGLITALGTVARGIPNLFFAGGARLYRDGDPSDDPGFRSVPALLREFPRDLHRFQHLEHCGGEPGSIGPFHGVRPISCQGIEGIRAQYARHDDGRFVLPIWLNGGHPGHYRLPVERAFTARVIPPDNVNAAREVTLHAGDWLELDLSDGVVVIGNVQ